jgi:DNA-binding Lrp family transcriptional regulator
MSNEVPRRLDKKDFRILYELDFNSRMPTTELARRVGLSQQVADYRLRSLVKEGVIVGAMALIDPHKLGYFSFRAYMRFQNVTPKKETEIIDYFKKHLPSLWVISTSGRWDLESVLVCRNPVHFGNVIKKMKADIGAYIRDYNLSASVVNYHFKRSYLIGAERTHSIYPRYGFEPAIEHLDEIDIKILEILSKDARKSNVEIGKEVGLTYNAVKKRIERLEERGVIQGYRVLIDLGKIRKRYYKALITLRSVDEKTEKRIYQFCASNPRITYLVEVMGEWDIELEAEVDDEEEFRAIMMSFRDQFGEKIQDYEILHVYKEHKMNYFPMAGEMLERLRISPRPRTPS